MTGENQYARQVAKARASDLLRQTYVERAIHCNFTPAELVAGVLAVQHRVETSTAHAKEFADLAHTKTMDVIAPFAALLKQDKAA